MKRILAAAFAVSILLPAADFWTNKEFTEWSDKDIQKILNDSPWAKKVSVNLDGPAAPVMGQPSGAGRGGRGGGGAAGGATGDEPAAPLSERGNFGGGAGGGGIQTSPSVDVTVRWATARPMREAVVKSRFGKEAGTSPDAKALLEREEMYYVIGLINFPQRGRTGDEYREALVKSATLTIKGKDSIAAAEAQVAPAGRSVEIYVMFPRTRALTLDDGEVEFSAKPGGVTVKQKFRLKDMVVKGKLEL